MFSFLIPSNLPPWGCVKSAMLTLFLLWIIHLLLTAIGEQGWESPVPNLASDLGRAGKVFGLSRLAWKHLGEKSPTSLKLWFFSWSHLLSHLSVSFIYTATGGQWFSFHQFEDLTFPEWLSSSTLFRGDVRLSWDSIFSALVLLGDLEKAMRVVVCKEQPGRPKKLPDLRK